MAPFMTAALGWVRGRGRGATVLQVLVSRE